MSSSLENRPRFRNLMSIVSYIGLFLFVSLPGIDGSTVHESDQTVARKLLLKRQTWAAEPDKEAKRIGLGCGPDDLAVYQGATAPLPNGIPTYTVEILNVSPSGCSLSDVHLACGWFSSARLINPHLFRRLGYDNCLVNDGQPILPAQSLSFQYANSFQYPLSVSYVTCN